jgi:hypothetical protein
LTLSKAAVQIAAASLSNVALELVVVSVELEPQPAIAAVRTITRKSGENLRIFMRAKVASRPAAFVPSAYSLRLVLFRASVDSSTAQSAAAESRCPTGPVTTQVSILRGRGWRLLATP